MVGQTISHYKIVQKIGQGGMGEVYLAEDTSLDRQVALKFLPEDLQQDETARRRFLREAKSAAALDHPFICSIFEIGEAEGKSFIAMEYVEGQTLKSRLQYDPMPLREALEIAAEIAEALEESHTRSIVHRDLKPANIMLTKGGHAKVMDFGLAKRVMTDEISSQEITATGLTKTGTMVGTIPYMSPEQVRGLPLDTRSDVFSFGVIFYQMLTGAHPFLRDHQTDTIIAILQEEPRPLSEYLRDLPDLLQHLVNKALAKDPDHRYQLVHEIRTNLEQVLQVSVGARYVDQTGPRAARAGILRVLSSLLLKLWVAIPVALALAALAAIAVWFVSRQSNIRWAREEALPEIERLIELNWRDFTAAYRLAKQAEEYIPDDPKLVELLGKCSLKVSIKTDPSGAGVYTKEYRFPERDWEYLGVSPIENVRLPIGILRWKLEKGGFETVLAASSTWNISQDLLMGRNSTELLVPYDLERTLDPKRNIPAGMVRVRGVETPQGQLPDFYIDRYELTNRKYKEFIDSGGYTNRDYWKHDFIKDGRTLSWENAMAEFVDETGRPGPAGWQAGDYPEGQQDYPVSGISWYEAAAYAESVGKSLPTRSHWGAASGEHTPLMIYPQLGGLAVFAPFNNFEGRGPVEVGSLPGITAYGASDMAGNVREWCWNATPGGRLLRGGAWDDNAYKFGQLSSAPAFDRSLKNGVRCALYPAPEDIPQTAFEDVTPGATRDFYKEMPVGDAVFEVYKNQFSYDPVDLHARVELKDNGSEEWIREKITFDAAYGDERIIAHLFLPKNTEPPYQTVIYFPGSASAVQGSSEDIERYYEFPIFLSFIVKNGRAVLYPVYKGTFERRDPALMGIHFGDESHLYTDYVIQLVKDFKRCIDYLESRPDIANKKLVYYGMSWGGHLGAIIPAVEERLAANVIVGGGLRGVGRSEVNQINYVGRVRQPTLMLNGKYDTLHLYETSIKPMFDLLGTPDADKELKTYDTDHIPPRNELIRETLAWLDRYLGPVN